MIITMDMVKALDPCYSDAELVSLAAGRTSVTPGDIAALEIPWVDRIWVLSGLMTPEQRGPYARRVALDVIHLWDAPEVVRRWLTTGDEALRDEAYAASYVSAAVDAADAASAYAASASAYAAADAVAAAVDAAAAAADAADAASAYAASASAYATKRPLYLQWAVEVLG